MVLVVLMVPLPMPIPMLVPMPLSRCGAHGACFPYDLTPTAMPMPMSMFMPLSMIFHAPGVLLLLMLFVLFIHMLIIMLNPMQILTP